MKVEVVEKRVEPMMGSEFDLVLHIPKVIEKGASITCLLDSKTGFSELGGYIYSIIDPRTGNVYQTVLNNSSEELMDIAKRLSSLITKKYNLPSYVAVSGNLHSQDSLAYIKEVLNELNSRFT